MEDKELQKLGRADGGDLRREEKQCILHFIQPKQSILSGITLNGEQSHQVSTLKTCRVMSGSSNNSWWRTLRKTLWRSSMRKGNVLISDRCTSSRRRDALTSCGWLFLAFTAYATTLCTLRPALSSVL